MMSFPSGSVTLNALMGSQFGSALGQPEQCIPMPAILVMGGAWWNFVQKLLMASGRRMKPS